MHPMQVCLCEMFITTDFPISPILPLTGPGIPDGCLIEPQGEKWKWTVLNLLNVSSTFCSLKRSFLKTVHFYSELSGEAWKGIVAEVRSSRKMSSSLKYSTAGGLYLDSPVIPDCPDGPDRRTILVGKRINGQKMRLNLKRLMKTIKKVIIRFDVTMVLISTNTTRKQI